MPGIHHVTAISGKAERDFDFYTRVLGLRFVKKTVNFDDPTTYHLYYGDEIGHPGDGPHVLRLGARGAGTRGRWPGAANRVSRARKLDGLLGASLRRTRRRSRPNRKALW